MAEFRLKASETRILLEAIQSGISGERRKGVGKIKRITRLLSRLEKAQGSEEIWLELPDAEDM